MKKMISLTFLFFIVISCSACGKGNVFFVKKNIPAANTYTEKEIRNAMHIVVNEFHDEFKGCTLRELRYDEAWSNDQKKFWEDQYLADEAIVLLSTFKTDSKGGDGSFAPDSVYEDWNWILVRDHNNDWKLKTWGY